MMKTIGIIGGMSSESTAIYYDRINALVRHRLGGLNSAELLIRSLNFATIADLQKQGRWADAGARLAEVARQLEMAGADVLLLATNTMHKVIEAIEAAVSIPIIHIADATAIRVQAAGLKRPGIIATAFTMEQSFYKGRLAERFGLEAVIPNEGERADIHRIIFDELCRGIITEASRRLYQDIAASLAARGADSLILGCTEVCMLLSSDNVSMPMFDTTALHAEAAVDFAMGRQSPAALLAEVA